MPRLLQTALTLAALAAAIPADGQVLGTFRWQLQPYCNVITLVVTQVGGVYRVEGTDDQCGAATSASVTGTAFPNRNGSIGLGLNVVTAPGGTASPIEATIALANLNGTWRGPGGTSGSFVLTPGAPTTGSPRPLPAVAVPPAVSLLPGGSIVARPEGDFGIPATGPGTRMMWYAGKAAFRAGSVAANEWDDANVGRDSVAFNTATRATGLASAALGYSTLASDQASVAMGVTTTSSGFASTTMGYESTASASVSTAMGAFTTASGLASTAMGALTTASGYASIAMGDRTTARGIASTAMGESSYAGGEASVALGFHALTIDTAHGSFAFADRSSDSAFGALGPNEFNVRASGGVSFYTNAAATAGVRLAGNGGNQWLVISDAAMKENFRDLDDADVLAKIEGLPIREWNYKTQEPAIRHVGPTAQDFHAAFGLGEDPLRIGSSDVDGIALRAIQALETRTRSLQDENAALREALAALGQEIEALRNRPGRRP